MVCIMVCNGNKTRLCLFVTKLKMMLSQERTIFKVNALKTMTCENVLSSHSEQLGKTEQFYTPALRQVANSFKCCFVICLRKQCNL